jgi:hypothetical protein
MPDKLVSVPLDPITLRRLISFSSAVGKLPHEAASALLRDLLADDELWNAAANDDGHTNH